MKKICLLACSLAFLRFFAVCPAASELPCVEEIAVRVTVRQTNDGGQHLTPGEELKLENRTELLLPPESPDNLMVIDARKDEEAFTYVKTLFGDRRVDFAYYLLPLDKDGEIPDAPFDISLLLPSTQEKGTLYLVTRGELTPVTLISEDERVRLHVPAASFLVFLATEGEEPAPPTGETWMPWLSWITIGVAFAAWAANSIRQKRKDSVSHIWLSHRR